MSWLVATIGGPSATTEKLHSCAATTAKSKLGSRRSVSERIGDVRISAEGLRSTFHFGCLGKDREALWIALGTGVGKSAQEVSRIFDQGDWENALLEPQMLQSNVEGQYVVIMVREHSIECIGDPVGLRDLFFHSEDGVTLVSTRLDWIASTMRSPSINANAFGGRWQFFYQLSYDALINGVHRLGPGGKAILTKDGVHLTRASWQDPGMRADHLDSVITELALAPANGGYTTDLALSGGLDSRLLFALYASQRSLAWTTHTFGPESAPDARIANELATDRGVPHRAFDHPLGAEKMEPLLAEFTGPGMMLRPASSCIQLQYFHDAAAEGSCIVDGSFGELARRQMLKRIQLFGRTDLLSANYRGLLKHLYRPRADIFTTEFTSQLIHGASEQLEQLSQSMPGASEIGVDNWLDLLVMKHAIPNVVAAEQTRIDNITTTFSPFVQASFFRSVLETPSRERRGGRLVRKIIASLDPNLTRYPLAGALSSYPYHLPPLAAYIYQRISARSQRGNIPSIRDEFLMSCKDLVIDTMNTQGVRAYSYYDQQKLKTIVEGYYNGITSLGSQLDWLFAFELWRRANNLS